MAWCPWFWPACLFWRLGIRTVQVGPSFFNLTTKVYVVVGRNCLASCPVDLADGGALWG